MLCEVDNILYLSVSRLVYNLLNYSAICENVVALIFGVKLKYSAILKWLLECLNLMFGYSS